MNLPLMTHCEDTNLINAKMEEVKAKYGDDPDVEFHPVIRDEEVCWNSSSLAVELAQRFGTRLHIAHVTTAKELSLIAPSVDDLQKITAEAVIAHLMFSSEDLVSLSLSIMFKRSPSKLYMPYPRVFISKLQSSFAKVD